MKQKVINEVMQGMLGCLNNVQLEMIRDLIKELGEKGFTAVDSENQVNIQSFAPAMFV